MICCGFCFPMTSDFSIIICSVSFNSKKNKKKEQMFNKDRFMGLYKCYSVFR